MKWTKRHFRFIHLENGENSIKFGPWMGTIEAVTKLISSELSRLSFSASLIRLKRWKRMTSLSSQKKIQNQFKFNSITFIPLSCGIFPKISDEIHQLNELHILAIRTECAAHIFRPLSAADVWLYQFRAVCKSACTRAPHNEGNVQFGPAGDRDESMCNNSHVHG